MENKSKANKLREIIRIFERILGFLDESQMNCCQMTIAQCHALVEIGRAKIISLGDLSRLLDLDNSTLSRTVDNLVKVDLVQRIEDPNDRRYIKIQLTLAGGKKFHSLEQTMNEYYETILKAIPPEKQNQVLESLQLLVDVFQKNHSCKKE